MLLSMTGYGSGSAQQDDMTATVEIRTVNHRFLDLHIRAPKEYFPVEAEIQQIIRGELRRGRVDVSIAIQGAREGGYVIDRQAVQGYIEGATSLRDQFHIGGALEMAGLLALPGVFQTRERAGGSETAAPSPVLGELIRRATREALENVLIMRGKEGASLRTDLLSHLARILMRVSNIRDLAPAVAEEAGRKMEERLGHLLPKDVLDPQRLAQEVALLADRCDVSEEIARLASHLEQFAHLVESGTEIGKRLDFLLQEMQREVNTILSKSGHLEIARCGIDIKADIEKIREQVQNVE